MNRSEIEEIAEEAASKALRQFFLSIRINPEDPESMGALQEDLRFMRAWRESTATAKQHVFKTVISVIVTGALGWLGLVLWKHQ